MHTLRQAEIVDQLRSAFDRSFAELPASDTSGQTMRVLALRIAGEACAIPIDEIASIFKHRKIVPLPKSAPELLGITGVRGACVPVYCLASLLGYTNAQRTYQWLVLCNPEEPVAFAFAELEGQRRIPRTEASAADTFCKVLHIPSLIAIVKQCCETSSQRSK